MNEESNKKRVVAKTQVNIFSSRWSKEMKEEDVIEVVRRTHDIEEKDVECTKLETKSTRHNAFLIQMKVSEVEPVYQTEKWPKGIVFRRYIFRENLYKNKAKARTGDSKSQKNTLLNHGFTRSK